MTKWVLRVVLLFGALLLLSGCWNSRELKDLAIVMGMGIDKVPDTGEYKVSFQIVNPSMVAPGTSGGGSSSNLPVTIYTASAKNVFEAIRKASQKSPRQLFFAHIRLLIIGEPLAKEGIGDLFDFFERSHEARLNTMVLIARGTDAETILKTLTPLEKIPANAIAGKLKTTSNVWSENMNVEVDNVIKALVSQGEPLISGVDIIGDPEQGSNKSNINNAEVQAKIEIRGVALFKDAKLERWVDGDAARGMMWVKNELKSTIVDLDCNDEKDALSIEVVRSYTGMKAEIQDGKPVIHISVREEGNVAEARCGVDLSKSNEILKLQDEWTAETKKEIMEAVKVAQKEKSDIFQFGEAVNRKDPKVWKSLKGDWDNTFAKTQVDVNVQAFIRRSGMRLKPYLFKENKKDSS